MTIGSKVVNNKKIFIFEVSTDEMMAIEDGKEVKHISEKMR